MISTVTNQGKVQFMIYSQNMNSDLFIEFLKQLIKNINLTEIERYFKTD